MTVDLDTVKLVVRTLCEVCDGEGEHRSDDWLAFEEWRSRRAPSFAGRDEEEYFLRVCGYTSVPPMNVGCDTCDGTGRIDAELPFPELVEAVLQHVDRPLIPEDEMRLLVGQVKQSITYAAAASHGLADGHDMGTWLRAVQEGAEALRALRHVQAERKDW